MGEGSGIRLKALISDRVDERLISRLRSELGVEVEYRPNIARDELLKIIDGYDILVVRSRTRVDREVLDRAARLRLIARAGVGLDNVDVEYALRKNIAIVNAPHAATESVAELAIALMLMAARNLHLYVADVKSGKWSKGAYKGIELRGRTLGIVGFGRIGRRVGELGKALGMRVVATDVIDISEHAKRLGVEVVSYGELLKVSDVVTFHVPLTKDTYHMLNDDALRLVKDNAIIVNTSRGEVIDAEALLRHIDRLWGVGLDVLEHEPPSTVHELELLKHPKVIAVPHIGAETLEAQLKVADEVFENIREALMRVVNNG